MTNAIDIEINTALEAYRAECARQNISRSIDHEKAMMAHLMLVADPAETLRSAAFANLSAEAQMPFVIRAVLHRWPDTDRGKLEALITPDGTDADTDDEGTLSNLENVEAPKPRKQRERKMSGVR